MFFALNFICSMDMWMQALVTTFLHNHWTCETWTIKIIFNDINKLKVLQLFTITNRFYNGVLIVVITSLSFLGF